MILNTGEFSDASGAIITAPYSLAPVSVGFVGSATQTIYYTAPASAVLNSSFVFTVTDAAGLVSPAVGVTIGIFFYIILNYLLNVGDG